MTLFSFDVLQVVPDPDRVSDAFGGGLAGLLAVIVVSLSGLLWLTLNGRLKDCKEANNELKNERSLLIGKLDAVSTSVERLSAVIERQGIRIDELNRELERRRGLS